MSWLQVVVLSVLQGLTEFLPVSSSGHLAIASRVFFADDAGASFTAVTQLGTEFAVLVYFARDIVRIVKAWCSGLFNTAARNADYRLGWYVIIGTIPIGLLGLLFKPAKLFLNPNAYICAQPNEHSCPNSWKTLTPTWPAKKEKPKRQKRAGFSVLKKVF